MDQLAFDQFGKSMVRLHSGGVFRGTGFVISTGHDECLIMTCLHVLRGVASGENVNAYLSGGNEPFECAVLQWDDETDVALLQSVPGATVGFDSVTPLQFLEGKDVALQMNIVLLAFYTLDDGKVRTPMLQPGTSTGRITDQPRPGRLAFSASSKPGTSGGAVICSLDGENMYVAGVLSSADLTSCYAASAQAVKEFLCAWVNSLIKDKDALVMVDTVDIKTMLEMGPRLQQYLAEDEEEEATTDDDEIDEAETDDDEADDAKTDDDEADEADDAKTNDDEADDAKTDDDEADEAKTDDDDV